MIVFIKNEWNWKTFSSPEEEQESVSKLIFHKKEDKNSMSKKKYTCGSLVPKLSKADMGKEKFEREFSQPCVPGPTKMIHSDDPNYEPYKWDHLLSFTKTTHKEKDRLERIEKSLERIEKEMYKLTGLQLINGDEMK